VAADGTTALGAATSQEDLVSGADLVLVTLNGALTIAAGGSGPVVDALGHVLLQARDTSVTGEAALIVDAPVRSVSGSMTLRSDGLIELQSTGHVQAHGIGGTVDVQASGAVVMAHGTGAQRTEAVVSAAGDIRIQAGTDVTLGSVETMANVALMAGGSLIDGDGQTDVTAGGLLLSSGSSGGVGSAGDALEVSVSTLTAVAGTGGAYVSEDSGLMIDAVDVRTVRLASDGTTSQPLVSAEDLTVTNGMLVLQVQTGDLTLRAGRAGPGGVLVSGMSEGQGEVVLQSVRGSVALDARVEASRQVTVLSGTSMTLTAQGDVAATAGAVQLLAGTFVQMAPSGTVVSAAQDIRIETGMDVASAASKDLFLGKVSTPADVVLRSAGSVVDGDGDIDVEAAVLRIETGAGGGIGRADDPLETRVQGLTFTAGTGGATIRESDALAIVDGGVVSSGDVSIWALQADFELEADLTLIGDANLELQANQGAVQQTAGTVSAEQGDVAVVGQSGASLTRVSSESGDVGVVAVNGGFDVPAGVDGVDYGDQPVRVRAITVDIGAPLSGTGSLELTTPDQTVSLLTDAGTQRVVVALPTTAARPIVIGDTTGFGGAPAEGQVAGVYLDSDEIGRLVDGFERIVIGTQDPTQSIWLQAPWTGTRFEPIVFRDPLVLVAAGSSRDGAGQKLAAGDVFIRGEVIGEGLTVWGSGSTTHLDRVILRQDGDVLISDTLIVDSDSRIEVTTPGGMIELRGSVVVRSGVTLALSADRLLLTGDPTATGDSLTLEAGATLVLGTHSLTVDADVTIRGGGGTLRLTGPNVGGVVTDFDVAAADLQLLALRMEDGSFGTIDVGVATVDTIVRSPSLWSEGADTVTLHGQTVRLGVAGVGAAWSIGTDATFRALGGDLEVHADLLGSTVGLVLGFEVPDGAFRMGNGSSVRAEASVVTVEAADGIEVTTIDAAATSPDDGLTGVVALDSAFGTIRLAQVGDTGLRAQSVSMFGQGPRADAAEASSVLKAQADRVQVAAARGMVFEGRSSNGQPLYRLMSKGQAFVQLQSVGEAPDRVLMPRDRLAAEPVVTVATALSASATSGLEALMQRSDAFFAASGEASTGAQSRAYLQRLSSDIAAGLSWARHVEGDLVYIGQIDPVDDDDGLLLSDLAYGLSEDDRPSFVMGLPGLQPISVGTTAQSDWLFDYVVA
jgi:hypothetical protein